MTTHTEVHHINPTNGITVAQELNNGVCLTYYDSPDDYATNTGIEIGVSYEFLEEILRIRKPID